MAQTVGTDLTQALGLLDRQDESAVELIELYSQMAAKDRFSWSSNIQFVRRLGTGGQGCVFLAQRFGADGFQVPVAVKMFSPDRYTSLDEYDEDMQRIASVVTLVSQIRHPNLLGINHFLNRDRIRVMIMEWIQGFDLRRMLTTRSYGIVKQRVSRKLWEALNNQLVTSGTIQPRLRVDVTLAILKNVIASLVALHDEGIVHGDVKPANVMLSKSGAAKLIDLGSAVQIGNSSWRNGCTPVYASSDVLEGQCPSPETDLVSLGHMAIELLTGKPLFPDSLDLSSLLAAKKKLERDFIDDLPDEATDHDMLVDLLRCLMRATQFTAPAGCCVTDLIQEMLQDVSTATANSLIKVWVDELWEVEELGTDGD